MAKELGLLTPSDGMPNHIPNILLLLFTLVSFVISKRGSRKHEIEDNYPAIWLIAGLIVLAILPSLVSFTYSIIYDPETPVVYEKLKSVIKERTLTNLSHRRKKVREV